MAKAAAIIITGIAIALLVIYGADVAAGVSVDGEIGEQGEGFLPFDHKTRGYGLGGPAMILPIIAYFIARNDPSKGLGGMIIIAGIPVIGMADSSESQETARNPLMETVPLLVIGLIQIGLGALKIKKS